MLNHLLLDLSQTLGGGLDGFMYGKPPIKTRDLENLPHRLVRIDKPALPTAVRRLINDPQQQLQTGRVDQLQMLQINDNVADTGSATNRS